MEIIPRLIEDLQNEAKITKRFLERFPEDKLDWKPHEKSMDMQTLANHIAELPGWASLALKTDGMDFAAGDYKPTKHATANDLVAMLEKLTANSVKDLENATEEDLQPQWSLRSGDQVFASWDKYGVVRHALAQTAHHRAQLGVYYRLLDIPVPATYGPSADEQKF